MKCKHCNAEKTSVDFYASNKTQCKECVKSSVKKNRLEKIEYYRAFDRMRSSIPHRVAARAEYSQTEKGKIAHRRALLSARNKFPGKAKARFAVSNALRDKRLFKTPCHVCGAEKVEGHHPDYSRPLDVVWLCNPHHREIHELAS